MKRLAVITTSLLLTLAAFGGTANAFAEESKTSYPEDGDFIKTLSFSDLKDYEIDGEAYYFADGDTYYKYENGELTNGEPAQFAPAQTEVTTDKYYYYFDENGELTVYEKGPKIPKTFNGDYSNLKQYGDDAYAIKNNVLYRFEGTKNPEEIILNYADYSVARQISLGQTADALKNYEALTFVTVKAGSYMTAIDLTSLDGEYFELDKRKEKTTDVVKEDVAALLLCYTGNAAIVAIGDTEDGTCYILRNSSSTIAETTVDCKKQAEFANATISGNRIYASPFTVIGTTLVPNATGTIVAVKNKLECAGVLNSVYYEVEFTAEDGTVKTGYVAYGHLTEYIIEDNKEPETVEDPEYSEKNNVTTVLLILAVVVLVLIAIGYVAFTATSGKKKGKGAKGKPDKKDTEENLNNA